MDGKQLIYNRVMQIMKLKRILLLCNATNIFLSMYQNEYYILKNKKDVVDFITNHDMPNDKPLVFGDLSFLSGNEQNCLLKFIEEAPVPMIVLASEDNLSPTIMSRFPVIIKVPYVINLVQKLSLKEFIKYKQNYEFNYPNKHFNIEEQSLKYCPEYIAILNGKEVNENLSEEVIDLCIANIDFANE